LDGVFRICLEPITDERGYFARTFCERDLAEAGLVTHYPEHSVSFNTPQGTLRGMHWQADPHGETKIVRCTRGRVFDVAVDIRPDSSTYRQWVGEVLSAENGVALYIPRGFAHGFITLEPDTELLYLISEPYRAELSRGFRWDDEAVGITWPMTPSVISERDRSLPSLEGV
jgi:dTDP-4-dehydrorhamnose 3,5-epimerase